MSLPSRLLAFTLSAALAVTLAPIPAWAETTDGEASGQPTQPEQPAQPEQPTTGQEGGSSVAAPTETPATPEAPGSSKFFTVKPKKTSITALKAGKKSLTVRWKKSVAKAPATTGATVVAVAGGHSPKAQGAHGYINEVTEDRKVSKALVKELERLGYTVATCTNNKATSSAELKEECRLANKANADLFVAIHFNAMDKRQASGVEVFYSKNCARGRLLATNVSRKLSSKIKLPDRGAKVHWKNLKVLRSTNMTAILVEVCYVDSRTDVAAYRKLGATKVGKVIAQAIAETKTKTQQSFGYQVRYSTQKSFAKGAKTVTVKGGSTTKCTLKGLKAKKRYYVKVRPWSKVNDRMYYGPWSEVKTVTTK